MSIERSIRGIVDFLQKNEGLLKEIIEKPQESDALGAKVDENRALFSEIVQEIEANGRLTNVKTSKGADVRANQSKLLAEIEDISKKITSWRAQPNLVANLYFQRAALYAALGNTFNEFFDSVIEFSQSEKEELAVLIRRATLDAEARQRAADLLDAAVQISKSSLKLAKKFAA